MDRIFSADNGFFRGITKLIDCIATSFCWAICWAPIAAVLYMCFASGDFLLMPLVIPLMVLAGPATSGLYYVAVKNIRYNHGYSWSMFWHGFKSSFKQAFLAGMLVAALLLLLVGDTYALSRNMYDGLIGSFCWFFIVLAALVLMWATNLFSYIARFEDNTKVCLKNSLLIAVANLPKTFLQTLIFLAFAYVIYLLWPFPLYFILPTLYMLIKSLLLEKTFRKYMSEEDLKEEDERNRDYKN